MRTLFICLALAAGCGGTTGHGVSPTYDMSISFGPQPDLSSPPDLSPPPDLTPTPDLAGGFCSGTPVAGTCAASFFLAVSKCWMTSGACTGMQAMTTAAFCWTDGARLTAMQDNVSMSVHGVWTMNGKSCMTGDVFPSKGGGGAKFDLMANGKHLIYDEASGVVTCPDGSSANIGSMDGMCVDVKAILNPDVKNCGMGACP